MAHFQRPAWATVARDRLPAARAAEAKQAAKQRAAAERVRDMQSRFSTTGRGMHFAGRRG